MQRTYLVTTSAGCERSGGGPIMSVPPAQSHAGTPLVLLITVNVTSAFCPSPMLEDLALMGMPDTSSLLKPNHSFWQQHAVRSRTEFVSVQKYLLAPITFYATFPSCSLPVLEQTMRAYWTLSARQNSHSSKLYHLVIAP